MGFTFPPESALLQFTKDELEAIFKSGTEREFQIDEVIVTEGQPGESMFFLLEGYVGAGAIDEHHIIASRETEDEIEFFYQHGGTGELELAYTLPLGEGAASPLDGGGSGIKALRTLVMGSTVLVQVNGEGTRGSFVRIDTHGGHSDAPIEDAAGLLLEAVDNDGTALLSLDDGEVDIDPATGVATSSAPRRARASAAPRSCRSCTR